MEFINRKSLKHRANSFIAANLILQQERFKIIRFTISCSECTHKSVKILEFTPSAIVEPNTVNRPEMILRDHFLDTCKWRNLWTGTNLCIESKRTTKLSIDIPVHRWYPIVWTLHFNAGRATNCALARITVAHKHSTSAIA